MNPDELKVELERMMDDMNLGEGKRVPIRRLDEFMLKQMLATHFRRIEEAKNVPDSDVSEISYLLIISFDFTVIHPDPDGNVAAVPSKSG